MRFASMDKRSNVVIIAAVQEYKKRMVSKHMRDRFVIPPKFVVPQKTTPPSKGKMATYWTLSGRRGSTA
jgi:hypothetical protein